MRQIEMDKKIGRELKAVRVLYGITQDEMAGVIGVIQSALSRIETGRQQLTAVQAMLVREYVAKRPRPFDLFINWPTVGEGFNGKSRKAVKVKPAHRGARSRRHATKVSAAALN